MTIDERVRDALHAYADPIEPTPGSWDRIEARLDDRLPRERRPRTPLVLAAVGILVIVALIAAVVVRDLDDDSSKVISDLGVAAPMPGRILAITVDRNPVILDSRTSQRVRGFGAFGGLAPGSQVAVSPDGTRAFVVQGPGPGGLVVRSALGCAGSQVVQLDLQTGGVDGTIDVNTGAPTVSPDGRYLAFLRCRPGNPRPAEIVLRDLDNGAETVADARGVALQGRLSFAPDSRHVVFDVWEGDLLAFRRFDLVGGEPVPTAVQNDGDYSTAFRGSSDEQLVLNGDRFVAVSRGDQPLGGGRLFRIPGPLDRVNLVSDRSGDHILATNDGSLYRWSVGDKEPTRLSGEYVGAAWIPGSDTAEPEPVPSALPPQRVLVFGTTAQGGGSMVILPSASRGGIGDMGAASGIRPGSPVSVTPDGAFAYVVRQSVNSRCGGGYSIFKQSIGSGARAGDEIPNATSPAVSPDGKYLAYLACLTAGDGPWLTLRDLRTGEVDSRDVAVDYDAARLQFSSDSSRLLVTSSRWSAVSELDVAHGRLRGRGSTQPAATFVAGYWGTDELVGIDQGLKAAKVVALPRTGGGAARTLFDASDLGGSITDVIPNTAGTAMLVIVDDARLFWWAPSMARPAKLDDEMTTVAWMPDATASLPQSFSNAPSAAVLQSSLPPGVLVTRVDGEAVSMGSTDGSVHETLATIKDLRWLSPVAPKGLVAAYGTESRNGACVDPRAEIGTIDLASQAKRRIVNGAVAPTVSPDGRFVAYGILCDGITLGFTDLRGGTNYRIDPMLRDTNGSRLRDIAPIAWSPDGKRLLYRVVIEGSEDPQYWIGHVSPRRERTDPVAFPPDARLSAAAFADDDTLAVASDDHGRSRVRFVDLKMRLARRGGFETPGHITRLVGDATGRHFLAVTDRRALYRWSVGDARPTKLADDVISAAWIPWS